MTRTSSRRLLGGISIGSALVGLTFPAKIDNPDAGPDAGEFADASLTVPQPGPGPGFPDRIGTATFGRFSYEPIVPTRSRTPTFPAIASRGPSATRGPTVQIRPRVMPIDPVASTEEAVLIAPRDYEAFPTIETRQPVLGTQGLAVLPPQAARPATQPVPASPAPADNLVLLPEAPPDFMPGDVLDGKTFDAAIAPPITDRQPALGNLAPEIPDIAVTVGPETTMLPVEPTLAAAPGPETGLAASAAPEFDEGSADVPAADVDDVPADPDPAQTASPPVSATNAFAAAPANAGATTPSNTGTGFVLDEPAPAFEQALGQIDTDLTPGRQTFPVDPDQPLFDYDDELILQLRVTGTSATETIIAYGTRSGVYLPVGELSRLLDLAIQVSDDGNYASGWFLSEERTLAINLRAGTIAAPGGSIAVEPLTAQAFDGEMFLRSDVFADILPLEIETDLRSQAVILTTKEPFPFEERMRRQAERERLNLRASGPEPARWPRVETPWAAFTIPMADVELRALSDNSRGERIETDLRLAGDLAFLTAQGYLSASSRDGLTAAILELGRRDADGDLLGPLRATEFLVGDVATGAMPLGLRGAAGRGAYVSNGSFEGVSVFDEIDFRGVLPDGYEVELYRNDILLGSTRERVNGQYEFLQVPVDYGVNVFRLVFYGPQGQRREEVRRINVGDGRLSPGELRYSAGMVERGVNLLGVRGPDFRPDARYGDWQAVGEISYGISNALTANASAAVFEQFGESRWLATTGLRTGIGALALRSDIGFSDGGGRAFGAGIGGRALGGGFTASHFEYSGPFVDEIRANGLLPLRRATELDLNTSLDLGGDTFVPVTLRGRRTEFQDGRTQTNATARASLRLPGFIASSSVNYVDFGTPGEAGFSQLTGLFDLATFNRSDTQVKGSFGVRMYPDPAIVQVAGEVSHAVDERTVVRGSAGYAFENGGTVLGLSAIREFDRFSLAFDGQYDFERRDHVAALRVNFSFGRDPLRGRFFLARPGLASGGAVAVRAFHDLDGDRVFGPGDRPLPQVTVSSASATAATDAEGRARIGQLGNGTRAVIQVDPSSLPDILMAPISRGVEIVPRAGRFHRLDFPIVELSEVEGTIRFSEDGRARGVSGLQLQMVDESGEVQDYVRTERGGYFFFERVEPGRYDLVIDPEQAKRLDLCLEPAEPFVVGPTSDIFNLELAVRSCAAPEG